MSTVVMTGRRVVNERMISAAVLVRIATFSVMVSAALSVAAASVLPPPRTPGSELIKIAPGQSKEEASRLIRAHSHKLKIKKDHTQDDSKHEHDKGVKKESP